MGKVVLALLLVGFLLLSGCVDDSASTQDVGKNLTSASTTKPNASAKIAATTSTTTVSPTTTAGPTTTVRTTTTVRSTTTTLKPVHYVCRDGKCLLINGNGEDECAYNRDCFHFECERKECVLVKTKGENTCNNTFDCITRWWDDVE